MALGVPRSASTSLWSYSFRRLKVLVSPPTGLGFISSVTHPCRLACTPPNGGGGHALASRVGSIISRLRRLVTRVGRVDLAHAMPPSCVVPRKPAGILLRRLWLTRSGSGADPSPAPLRLSGTKVANSKQKETFLGQQRTRGIRDGISRGREAGRSDAFGGR